jgi:hypothetical protein
VEEFEAVRLKITIKVNQDITARNEVYLRKYMVGGKTMVGEENVTPQ